jgi:putative tryptophan/tyrosine transport system substrate-binding protein
MRFDQLGRRDFIMFLSGAAVAWPLAARGQKSSRRLYRIGILSGASVSESKLFPAEMKKLGYIEGQDYVAERRFASFKYDRLPALALELVQLNVDVIVATTRPAVQAAQQATATIPIVMYVSADPVGMGLVASLARPGANTTGLSAANDETYPKQLELLNSAVPNLSRIAFLINPTDGSLQSQYISKIPNTLQDAAAKLGITMQRIDALNPADIETAFAAMKQERAQAVMMNSAPLLNALRSRVSKLAVTHKLPSISQSREYAQVGGLMSYGEGEAEIARRIAYFVDKILKGAKPADLPVELPTRFNLAINLRTAKALGLTIPPSLLVAATDVIE